jgi:F-box protein 18 (helicase)
MASQQLMIPKVMEEINLLYVAVTRSKNKIKIHEQMVPKGFPESAQIEVLKVPEITDKQIMKLMREDFEIALAHQAAGKPKGIGFDKIREKHKDAYRPWTIELDEELTVCYCQGWAVEEDGRPFWKN